MTLGMRKNLARARYWVWFAASIKFLLPFAQPRRPASLPPLTLAVAAVTLVAIGIATGLSIHKEAPAVIQEASAQKETTPQDREKGSILPQSPQVTSSPERTPSHRRVSHRAQEAIRPVLQVNESPGAAWLQQHQAFQMRSVVFASDHCCQFGLNTVALVSQPADVPAMRTLHRFGEVWPPTAPLERAFRYEAALLPFSSNFRPGQAQGLVFRPKSRLSLSILNTPGSSKDSAMKAALFAAVLALFSSACFAQTASSSPTNGIVTIAFNTAVLQTNEAQRELSSLQTKFAPKQAHLEALNGEIEALQKQAAADPSKVNSINAKEKQLQREGEDFRTKSQTASEQTFQSVAQKVYAFLQEFSSQHGYTAVIERGSDASPVVWYAAANLDITKTVVDAYNARAATSNSAVPNAPSAHQGVRQQNKQ